MAIYSSLLFVGSAPASGGIVFTVPATYVCVVRDIEILNYSGATASIQVQINVSGSSGTIYYSNAVPNLETQQWKGRVVLPAGTNISASSTSSSNELIISGYLLLAP